MASKDIQVRETQPKDPSYRTTYHIVENPTTKAKLVKQDDKWILWASTTDRLLRDPVVHIRDSESAESPTVAAAQLKSNGKKGLKVVLGGPERASRNHWGDIRFGYVDDGNDTNNSASGFMFPFEGQIYVWKRAPVLTRFKDVGNGDLTLHATWNGGKQLGEELGKYLRHRKAVSPNQTGRIDFSVDAGRDFELMCVTTIIGLEEAESRIVKKHGSVAGYGLVAFAAVAGVGC